MVGAGGVSKTPRNLEASDRERLAAAIDAMLVGRFNRILTAAAGTDVDKLKSFTDLFEGTSLASMVKVGTDLVSKTVVPKDRRN
jgi:hypothetical protein